MGRGISRAFRKLVSFFSHFNFWFSWGGVTVCGGIIVARRGGTSGKEGFQEETKDD